MIITSPDFVFMHFDWAWLTDHFITDLSQSSTQAVSADSDRTADSGREHRGTIGGSAPRFGFENDVGSINRL
jgi:hypothetical protein